MIYHLDKSDTAGRVKALNRIHGLLVTLSLEKAWRVEVNEAKSRRSDQQNRYLWGVCYPTIMQHLPGWDAEDVHEFCLGEWSGWEVIEGFGRKRMKPIRRSSKLSKVEFMNYVDFIHRTMAERGIVIPDPEPT